MSNNSKRISIARAIMYKELAKRNAERELECKRRGLWALWQQQTRYKTLWHFLRASNDRLILLCDECAFSLFNRIKECGIKMSYFERCFTKNPCNANKEQAKHYFNLYNKTMQIYNAIITTRNNLEEAIHNENQN